MIAQESLELHHISESSDRPQPTPSQDLVVIMQKSSDRDRNPLIIAHKPRWCFLFLAMSSEYKSSNTMVYDIQPQEPRSDRSISRFTSIYGPKINVWGEFLYFQSDDSRVLYVRSVSLIAPNVGNDMDYHWFSVV